MRWRDHSHAGEQTSLEAIDSVVLSYKDVDVGVNGDIHLQPNTSRNSTMPSFYATHVKNIQGEPRHPSSAKKKAARWVFASPPPVPLPTPQ